MSDQATERVDDSFDDAKVDVHSQDVKRRSFFGQPWTLRYIVNVEVWDQFSYFGLQAIVLIYLMYSTADGGLGIAQSTAVGLVAAYAGLTYLGTVVTGWMADRLLGCERLLFWSACVVAAGHVALAALPGLAGLLVGLVLVAVGSGGVKSGSVAAVGGMYGAEDVGRDSGFALYYGVIKIGGLLGPIVVGVVQVAFGFHAGFAVAAAGMFFGLAYYSSGRRHLPQSVKRVVNPLPASLRIRIYTASAVGLLVLVALVVFGVINLDNVDMSIAIISGIALAGVLANILRDPAVSLIERKRVVALFPTLVVLTLFSAAFVLQYTMLVVFADGRVDRNVGGYEVPVAWATALVAFAAMIFIPPIAALWTRMGTRQPSTAVKIALGMGAMGLAVFAYLTMTSSADGKAPLWGLALVAALCGVSDAMCVPSAFSMTTSAAPKAYSTRMVSVIFLTIAVGSPLGATLVDFYTPENETSYFLVLGSLSIAVGVVFALLSTWLFKRATRGSSMAE